MMKPKIWAHRGASAYAPENTMPAFELAVSMGADGIETDVHLTRDGALVLCHDDTLDRVSDGTGPIWEKDLAELRSLDFGGERPGYANTRIVMLEELLAFAKRQGLFVNIEMKYSGTRWEETNLKTANLIKKLGVSDQVLFSSFKLDLLLSLNKLVSSGVGLLYDHMIENAWEFAQEHGLRALHPHYSLLACQELPQRCCEAGILLHPWTLDEPENIRFAIEAGVDALITNRPDTALKIRSDL